MKYLSVTVFEDRRTDDALVVAAGRGDRAALEAFYRRHLGAVTAFHLRRTGRRELAFDLTAETFAAVVVASPRFDPELGSAVGWLFGIAANKLRGSLRRGRVEEDARLRLGLEPVVLEDADLERVDELASIVGEDRLADLLALLPEAQRDAILAHVVDDRSYEEIADDLDCSQAVVRQRVARGLRTMRTRLEGTR
ncbi:MAG: RNA polymerase sigma factor [Solirubrobacteraceae bacterium]|nr:RNA polymerase sigma factor [Solirubrobacteraceae bacterium]